VQGLYNQGVAEVVRREGGAPQYPLLIEARDGSRRAELKVEGPDKSSVAGSLWDSAYLLPSRRIAFLGLAQGLAAMLWGPRAEAKEVEAAKAAAPFLQPVAQMLTMGASLLEPALKPFLDDLVSVLLGRGYAKVEPLELKDVGAISVEVFPLVPLMLYRYRDPFDGAVDLELIQRFTSRAARGSLIVIEELENFKHLTLLIDLVREVARKLDPGRDDAQ